MDQQVIVIEPQHRISAVIAIKQALEQTGDFMVYPFTDAYTALDFLSEKRVAAAVVSLHVPDYPGIDLIESVKLAQPDIEIIASTSDSTLAARAISAGAVGLLQANYSARDLLDTIRQLKDMPAKDVTASKPKQPAPANKAPVVFERLAAEEPPLPGFRGGGTITNFMARVSDSELSDLLHSINEVMDIADDDIADFEPEITDEDTVPDTTAQFILEDALGDTIPLDESPFEQYLEKIRGETESSRTKYIKEPDFLDDEAFEDDESDDDYPQDQFNQTTQPSEAELKRIEEDTSQPETVTLVNDTPLDEPGDQMTDSLKLPTIPPEDTPEASQRVEAADVDGWTLPPIPEPDAPADPRIAQMAVSLTQASLEAAAEALVLSQGQVVIAYAGELSDADVAQVLGVVNDEDIKPNKARIQFITMKSSGIDYLIYSRRTADDFILSMICDGATSMTDIRTQSRRLLAALDAVPQMSPEDLMSTQTDPDEPEAAVTKPSRGGMRLVASGEAAPGLLTTYTFLWVPRDNDFTLPFELAETIDAGMRTQLAERGWRIDLMEVQEDYVYIVAGTPGDKPPQQRVRELQQLSAQIAAAQNAALDPNTLWAESYFVLAPGRELNVQEIQQYINFYRI